MKYFGDRRFEIRVELKQRPIHGSGSFEAEPLKKDQLIWQYDLRVDILIPVSEFKQFPPAALEMLNRWTYVEDRDGRKVMVLCGDHVKFMNHSDNPNVYESGDNLRD